MKVTNRQLRKIIHEATMYQLWANYDHSAVKAAEATIQRLGLNPENAGRAVGGMIESDIHSYLNQDLGLERMSDEIFDIGDQALEVVAIMLGLPKDTF